MAEETTVTIPENATGVADPELELAAEFLGSIAGAGAVDLLKERVEKDLGKYIKPGTVESKEPPTPAPKKPAAAQPAEGAETPADEQAAGEQNEELDSPFLKKKVTASTKEYKTVQDIQNAMKERFSFDDPNKFMEVATGWRKDAEEKTRVEEENVTLRSIYERLPDGLAEAVLAFTEARDYKPFLQDALNGVDYTKPFAEQDKQALLKKYNPDLEVNELDFEDKDDPTVKVITNTLKKSFELDKQQLESRRADIAKTQQARAGAIQQSIVGSVNELSKALPSIKKEQLTELQKLMRSGDPVAPLIYDKEGNYSAQAAENLYYAKFGKSEVSKLVKIVEKLQNELADLTGRGGEEPRTTRRQPGVVQDAEIETIQQYFGVKRDNPYEIRTPKKTDKKP